MPLDPSIILGSKPVEQINPVDLMTKALTMKQLSQKSQLQDREFQDQTAIRNAYKNNVVQNPDGSTGLNMQGLLNEVGRTSPQAQIQLQQQIRANALAQQEAQMKAQADRLDYVHTGLGQVNDQASLDNFNAQMKAAGIPNADQTPTVWNPQTAQFIADKYKITSNATQRNKEIDQQTARGEADAKRAEAGLPALPAIGGAPSRGVNGTTPSGSSAGGGGFAPPPKMQFDAMKEYNSAVAGSRQQDDAKRALLNIQSAKNLEEIAKLAPGGDLNKLNNQQAKTAIAELVKMVTGSVPTEGEQKDMTPDNLAQKYASVIQQATNKSQPANAGEFIQQGIDYANGIRGVAAQNLRDRASEFADRQRKFLGEKNYQLINSQIADEFKRNSPAAKQSSGQDYPVGTTAKSKNGTPVVYKGNGVWEPQ